MRVSRSTTVAFLAGISLTASGVVAFDAMNAHKVDGKHAVGAAAGVNARKGKLVATRNTTGRLPNNIIAKAPDARKLGGTPAAAYRTVQLMPQGAAVSAGATVVNDGVNLPATGTSTMTMAFVVPPDYPGDNASLQAHIVFSEFSAGACSIDINASGLFGPDAEGRSFNGAWVSPSGTIDVPAGNANTHQTVLTWPGFNPPTEAGQFMQLRIDRSGDDASDTCGAVGVRGVLIRY